ncbi:MAG: AsmA-like C-terminal region-containing protein [Bacteroidota bacterium]
MFKNKWFRIFLFLIGGFAAFVFIVFAIAYTQQNRIIQEALTQVNQSFKGRLEVSGSRISPFENFPYISIDLQNLEVYESKSQDDKALIHIRDSYVGFDFWSIVNGNYEVKKIKLDSGYLRLTQYKDGTFNIVDVFSSLDTTTVDESSETSDAFNLNLKAIELSKIDILKYNEEKDALVEVFIESAQTSLKTADNTIGASLDTRFLFNLIIENDTSFLHDKHVELHTAFNLKDNMLELSPSELLIEQALFLMEGYIDLKDNMNLDLVFSGNKPNFDLFLAFVPPELNPLISRYDNGGEIYFDATVKGPSINGYDPQVEVDFGATNAYVHNTVAGKEINELFFKGHFTNGSLHDPTTMVLTIDDFSAKPESGNFEASVSVKNFESPDIDVQLNSEFNLDFLTEFFDIQNLENVSGNISLQMNFHDIIDLSEPEKSIERLNESYFTELKVKDLNFNSTDYPLPIRDVNIYATMNGHEANINQFDFKIGKSDMAIKAIISDLPAIIHHTDIPVEAMLDIKSSLVDIEELSRKKGDSTVIKEKIQDLDIQFKFNSSARAFTESPNLPIGEFFIEKLSANFANYPHRLHDFKADVLIDSVDFKVIDFTGMIDESDFHFNGKLNNYDLWFDEKPTGTTRVDFTLNSSKLQLADLFSYGGENYVPKDYREESFVGLNISASSTLEFKEKLHSAKLMIDDVRAYMKVHKMQFDDFSGEFFMDSTQFKVRDFGGKLGNSEFNTNLVYFRKRLNTDQSHSFSLESKKLDFDQLFSYQPPALQTEIKPENKEEEFNIFELPFSNMNFSFDIEKMNYHRYLIDDFILKGRMQTDHYVYVDTMALRAAGGQLGLNGYFNGSDPKSIYFSPNMEVENVDLDELLFKFENFGQDHLVSENLSGALTGKLDGKIRMHADMVPVIDNSELNIDFKVVNGSLNNYTAFEALSGYFTDKNLSKIRFDTLRNELEVKNGKLIIPSMNINSTLGYFEVSGEQSIDQEMEYYVRIPLKVIAKAGIKKLFGKKDQDNSDQVDEIQYRDEDKRTRFLNLKITGTPDDYDVSLGKDKS